MNRIERQTCYRFRGGRAVNFLVAEFGLVSRRNTVQKPGVLQSLLGRRPLVFIHAHKFAEEILGALTDVLEVSMAHFDIASAYFGQNACVFIAVEGRTAHEHDVEDDTCGPDIALVIVVVVELEDFRCDVVRGTASLGQMLARLKLRRESEIDQLEAFLDVIFFQKDQVLRLDVPMHDILRVQVAQDS